MKNIRRVELVAEHESEYRKLLDDAERAYKKRKKAKQLNLYGIHQAYIQGFFDGRKSGARSSTG